MSKARLVALTATAVLVTGCAGGGSSGTVVPTSSPQPAEFTRTSSFTARNNVTGEVVHIFPTRGILALDRAGRSPDGMRATSSDSANLVYHGGPVQTSPRVYVVFWGASWNAPSGDPDGVNAQLKAFLTVIGGSRWLNSVTQYTQSNGEHVGNAGNIFVDAYVDETHTPPLQPTQSQLSEEARRAAARFGDYSASAHYIVALPHGISPSGFGTQYCAWHSWVHASGGTIAYTNLPYIPDAGFECGAGFVNTPGTLDGVTIVGGHEQAEVETDPQPDSGWLDQNLNENGDKCAWTNLENNPTVNGFPTQPLWSNKSSSCVQA